MEGGGGVPIPRAARIARVRRQMIAMANWTFVLLFALSAATAFAAKPNVEDADRDASETAPAPSVSLQDASEIVRQAYGGRVVSATEAVRDFDDKTKRGYDVRVDVEGRVKTVFVDRRGRIYEQR